MDASDATGIASRPIIQDTNVDSKQDEVDGSPVSEVTDVVFESNTGAADPSLQPASPAATQPNQALSKLDNPGVLDKLKPNESILRSEPRSTSECDDGEADLVIDLEEANELTPSEGNTEGPAEDDNETKKEPIQSNENKVIINDGENVGETPVEQMDTDEKDKDSSEGQGSESEPVIEVVSKDIGLDYFERLENSLRELEKQMSSSGNPEIPENSSDSESAVERIVKLPAQNGLDNTKEPNIMQTNSAQNSSSVGTGNTMEGPKKDVDSEDMIEKEKDSVVAPSEELTDKAVESKKQGDSVVELEKPNSNQSGSSAKDTVRLPTANANDMWSKIGMMRCSNCSFTTDQEAMLNSHTVICSKRKVVKGEINFKYKADRYGCEACLYTTKSVRNFEEHVAFHLLAQPYICLKCVATFESKASIETHVSTKHCDEMVKCGLRGSKKISHIIATLHRDSKFSFIGRMLDKKIWNMSISTTKDQNALGPSGAVPNTARPKRTDRPLILQRKDSVKFSSPKSDPLVLEPLEKTEKTLSEKGPAAKPVTSQFSPQSVPKTNISNSSIPITTTTTSTGGLNVPSFILVPVTMATQPPPPVIQPNKAPGMVSILGPYSSSFNAPRQQMIVMNQGTPVRPATASPRFMLVPTTSTPTSKIIHPSTNIFIGNQTPKSNPIQIPTTVQPKLVVTSQQLPAVSGKVSSQLQMPSSNSASTSQCISIQYNEVEKANATSIEIPGKDLNTDDKLGSTVIDLTEGSAQNTCRISFRKAGSSYACNFCKVTADTEEMFSRHIWRHLHTLQPICKNCPNDYSADDFAKCDLVVQVMKGLVNAKEDGENDKGNDSVIEVVSDDEDTAEGQQLVSSTDVHMEGSLNQEKTNTNTEEDSGMQIKIASTYSLSESSKTQEDVGHENELKSAVSSEEITEEVNSTSTMKIRDSGNIFEKLQGSINNVVEQTYVNVKNNKEDPHSCDQQKEDASVETSSGNAIKSPSVAESSGGFTEALSTETVPTLTDSSKETTSPSESTTKTTAEPITPKFSCNGSFYVCGFTDCRFACITSGEYREHLMCWHSDAEEYKCAHCGHRSLTEDCHLRHMLTHSKASSFILYMCSHPACLYGTNVVDLFRDHWKKFHPNTNQFKCRSCKMLFPSAEDLITHIQANILKFVTCPHCTAKDSNRKTIIAHIIEVHPGKPRQITVASQLVCQERDNNEFAVPVPGIPDKPTDVQPWPSVYMDSANDDDDDVYADSPEQNNSCDDTEVDDEQPDNLQQSDLSKAKGSLTKIAAEGDMRDAVKVMALNKSKLKSLSAEIIRCPECSYLASGRGLLRKHLYLHKKGKDERKRRFSCPCCPAAMDKLSKLSCHMNLHEGQHKVKVYFCTLCAFKTNVKEFLSTHMGKSHNCEITKGINFITKVLKVSVSAFFCDKCMFGTRDQQVFRQHELGHNDDEDNAATTHEDVQGTSYPTASSSTSVPKPLTKKSPSVRSSYGDNLNEEDLLSVNPGSRKRFCCKLCGKYCSRLPALKAHMSLHVLDADLEVMVFKCQYCAYSSTYKAFVSRHCEDKHPGKIIRVKRRVDVISAAGESFPPHGQEWPESPDEMDDPEDVDVSDMSIYSHHCDICSYSCGDAAELLRHKNSQHPNQGIQKTFIVPSGNVFKSPVECTECSFSTTRRIELLRHLKTHPALCPTYEALSKSPPKEQRELLKVAIGKKTTTPHLFEPYSDSPSPDPESEHTPSPQMEDKKPTLAEDGSLVQEEMQKPKAKTPLYFLGGDLLHLKLRPCFIQEESNSEFTCKLCQDTFSGRYVLHKHILQHMDVSFYKCAYCSHGTLESPSMVVHIQKIHRKPIQHVQMDVTDLESKINKAIHSIKEEEYFIKMQEGESVNSKTEGRDDDSVDDFQSSETLFRSPFKVKIPPLTIKTSPSYDIVKKKSASTAKKSTTSKPKIGIVNKPVQKPSLYKQPTEDNPNIQRMGDIYKCKICSYTSTSRATVLNHLTIHSGFRRFGCPFCPYRSHWRHDCLKHIRTHHPGKQGQPTMDEPPADFDTSLTLKPEKSSVTQPQPQPVPKAPKLPPQPKQPPVTLESQPSAESEADQDNTPEYRHVFKCLVCDTKFKSIWSIQKHFSRECSQPMLGCSTCKFKDLEPGTVKLHIETKHPGSETSRIVTLKREAKMRKYTIPTFKKQESKESIESTSVKSVQSDNADQEQTTSRATDLTSTTASQYSKLKSPILSSNNLSILIKRIGNRYMCKECGFSNPIKRALMRHVKKHSNARPFGCTYCDYRSNNECNTKRHMRRRHIGKPVVVKRLDPSQWYSPITSDLKYRRKPFSALTTTVVETSTTSPDEKEDGASGMDNSLENDFKTKARVEIRYFWKCLECGNKSHSVSNAYRHLKRGTCTKTLYGCSGCKLKNTDRKAVEFHLSEKHLNKNVQITICPNTAKIRKYHIPIKVGGYEKKPEADVSTFDDTSNSATSTSSNTQTMPKGDEDCSKQNSEKSQVVFCTVCNLKASNARIFQSHIESEHTGMLMVCKHCTIFRTLFVSKIQQHTWDSHPDMPLKFYLRTKKGIPDAEKRPSERYTCAKCDYIGKRSSVRQHLYCHFEYKPYKCGHCGYQTKKNDGVRRHIEKQHIGKPMKILFKRNAAQEQEIEMLLDSNSPVKLSYQKSHAARLAKESLSHIKSIPKPIIKKNYPTSANMKNIATEDYIPSKMYKPLFNNKAGRPGFTCLLCPYNTFMQNTMISHVYHHMDSIYRCPYCSNHGYPRSRVTTHIRKQHPGKAVYVIDERQNKGGLTNAIASSTVTSADVSEPAEKRRKIDNSDDSEEELYTESTSDNVKEETGIIQYSCHLCSYSSESLYHYRQHLAAHGGFKWLTAGTQLESRLKCGYCSYLAAGDKDFNTHMEKHLATRPFSCPYCDFSQYTQGKVKTHVAYAHPDKPMEVSRESGSSCLIDDTLQLDSVTLVRMDPTIKLVDFLSLGASEYEKILLEANVSVVDLDSLSDDRFSEVASNLGVSLMENEYQVKKESEYDDYDDSTEQYDDHVVKTEHDDCDVQKPTVAAHEEMDISTMVATAGNNINSQDILREPDEVANDVMNSVSEVTENNYEQERTESAEKDTANDFSDVSDAPLSQDGDSEDVDTADESLLEMDFESVSQESADVKSLPESSVNENVLFESAIDTEEEATVQYESTMEEEEEFNDQQEPPMDKTDEELDKMTNEEEEPSELDTSGEPMWASQGFQVIDEV
ncbi:uncharacterized protein LOC110457710 [Mizuhopecten yessoensis]|uniref:RE1-silencing transcription factor n=1 Tax=Mizuhopecten yessoensis TaxID=6573 RepID=A0A210Q826_MIZYE|nr:uncharacterized protein LOC110457710 [Mizuhopecten yessoensis]XP_021364756.1 uncharacterized protein LOC110457710 [Mizuhopecten yessoensis]OWF44896.1 RE1-silencing transcription factor [Mizuhopecten yessoensis]